MAWISMAMLAAWLGGPVNPEARAFFPTLLVEFGEGSTTYGYPDNLGNITIGRGNMLPAYSDFLALDWQGASVPQIRAAWNALQIAAAEVRRDGPDKWPGGGHYANTTTIRASQDSIDALIGSRLNEIDAVARAEWPGWDDAPPKKQEALARIMWACGPEIAPGHGRDPKKTWPKLHAAWIARDRDACAAECRIPSLDKTEPGANDLEASLFEADDGWGDEPERDTQPAI